MSPSRPRSAGPPVEGLPVNWRTSTGSTQDEARRLLSEGALPPFAVATTDQRSGRGRLGRTWSVPPGQGLALTVVHAAALEPAARSWYPLVAGLALIGTVDHLRGAARAGDAGTGRPGLKWPNDAHDAEARKLAGILVETSPGGDVLVGIGVNLLGEVPGPDGEALPGTTALTDVTGLGADAVRAAVPELAARLAALVEAELRALDAASGDAVATGQAARYRETCITVGREVRVSGIGARPTLEGLAHRVDDRGRLVVRAPDGTEIPVEAGDVLHVRPGERDEHDDEHIYHEEDETR